MNQFAQSSPTQEPQAAVQGELMFGVGPDATDYVRQQSGRFDQLLVSGPAVAAISGAVRITQDPSGLQLLLGDLVSDAGVLPERWRGRFVLLRHTPAEGVVRFCSDHFASLPLYYASSGDNLIVSTDLRFLLDCPWLNREVDQLAVYHYLNFAYVPAPFTILQGVVRLPPATEIEFATGRITSRRYWSPPYSEDLDGDAEKLADELRERIIATVQRYRPSSDAGWGCFLSGGTDSSSITSILARQHPDRTVHAFSIGFSEGGYDELEYAQLAAKACGAQSHSRLVSDADSLALLPTLLDICDQPFGNASTIPTHACARLAADEGVHLLLAGDGGDEIFGGNERYAKDHYFGLFHRLPAPLRAAGRFAGSVAGRSRARLAQRIQNFAERGSLPNPDRFYTDDAFASEYFDTLLEPGFASRVRRDDSLDFLRQAYGALHARSELHRLMGLDLDFAIARCDLVKVHGASIRAGVGVRYPFLDVDLVEFTGRLPAHWKVNGANKRVLFKQAMASVLPAAILRKPKQGFGLPVSVWFREDQGFRTLVRDSLLGQRARQRGWIRPAQVEVLLREHDAGSWDWSAELWRLLVLELWLEKYLGR